MGWSNKKRTKSIELIPLLPVQFLVLSLAELKVLSTATVAQW